VWNLEGLRDPPGDFRQSAAWGAVLRANNGRMEVVSSNPAGIAYQRGLFGGDRILRNSGGGLDVIAQPFDRSHYRDAMQAHLRRLARESSTVGADTAVDLDAQLPRLQSRVAGLQALPAPHEIRVQGRADASVKVAIDLQRRTIARRSSWEDRADAASMPYHLFKVDDGVLAQWLRSEISFEEVMGTRKFTLTRVPNRYDPEILRVALTGL